MNRSKFVWRLVGALLIAWSALTCGSASENAQAATEDTDFVLSGDAI